MLIPLSIIHVNLRDRLRVEQGDIRSLAASIARIGQLQAIVIRPSSDGEVLPAGKEWIITAGARRFLAVSLLSATQTECKYGPPPGMIEATTREQMDDLLKLMIEFRENDDRLDFSWKEKASYVKKIHDLHIAKHGDRWTPGHTAAALDMGESTVYKYLEFASNPDLLLTEEVSEARSFQVAYKQFKIQQELKKRKTIVEFREQQEEERRQRVIAAYPAPHTAENGGEVVEAEPSEDELREGFARKICSLGDCREWIRQFPDGAFDWIHWDPPYGGEQGGGARPVHKLIDDTWSYASSLLLDMIPELYRVLKPNHWLALWVHPAYVGEVSRMLAGHVQEGDHCIYCMEPWNPGDLGHFCVGGDWSFWVNPYPNVWYKVDRMSDGHEITRFLTNAYETFLLAGKLKKEEDGSVRPNPGPLLIRSDRQNVFTFPMVPKGERRHVMHKPTALIEEIISCISVRGETGCDPSFGSGSSIEAALGSRRRVVGCELDEDIYSLGLGGVEDFIKKNGILPYDLPGDRV